MKRGIARVRTLQRVSTALKRIPSLIEMKRSILQRGKWLSFGVVTGKTPDGRSLNWEFATRENTSGAVCILAVNRRVAEPTVILVQQFRAPIASEILEFPAGLIENGQTVEEAALRELREETGYVGTVSESSFPVFNSPGLTDECVSMVCIEIEEKFSQETEVDEEIEVVELPLRRLKEGLLEIAETGVRIDAKLWNFALGLSVHS